MTDELEKLIRRLEECIDTGQEITDETGSYPVVEYCLECDEMVIDDMLPAECVDHPTLHQDGWESAGLSYALTTLRYLKEQQDD